MQAATRSQAPALRDFLRSLPDVHALVADMLDVVYAVDVAAEVGVPGHLFFSTGAATLSVFLGLPLLCSRSKGELKDLGDAPVSFPGAPPMPASHLVDAVLDSGTDLYATALDVFGRMAAASGVLVNTFEALESSAVAALRDGRCLPGRATPPVYCIGPVIAQAETQEETHPCLPWLDAQPERSVVFLCFGSRCTVSPEQIGEMAKGLEKSGHRFLWVLRAPPAFAAAACLRRSRRRAGRGAVSSPRGVLGPDRGQRPRGHRVLLGASGGGAASRVHRRVREPLRMELDAGGDGRRRANGVLAIDSRAVDEQGVFFK
jgi:hypothetical protein